MNKSDVLRILSQIVEVLRVNGVIVDSPYDVENFFVDYGQHSNYLETGCFPNLKENDE